MPTPLAEYERVADALRGARRVCILTHVRPDADAVGSACALAFGLEQLGKETRVVIGQDDKLGRNLLTIPGAERIETRRRLPHGYDLYVTVDCGSLERTGAVAAALAGRSDVVCIDHHDSNPGFGTINLVAGECESTTVVLTQVLDLLAVQLDRELAHCLYAGLVTDTGCFRWGRPVMHDYASRFMQYGLDTKQIAVDIIDSTTAADLQMLGRVLADLRTHHAGGHNLGILVASLEATAGASEAAVESLVDFVWALQGTDLGVVFKEQTPGEWAVSLRSSSIDCAHLATGFGGGGHIPAAGYSTSGTPQEVIDQLVRVVGA